MTKFKPLFGYCIGLLIYLLFTPKIYSQSPSDALMMSSRKACVLANYEIGRFDYYWEGELLRDNQTIALVRRNTLMPMLAVGIFDRLNFFVGTPYVKTESSTPNGGKFAGTQGFQDIYIGFKYQIINKKLTNGNTFSVLANVGFSTPMSDYLSDYMPYSLGFGAPELSYRGIIQFSFEKGYYARASGAYLWRGYTEVERDYYYNNGSYYTPWMDVPSAWHLEGVIGSWFLNKTLKVEMSYTGLKSTSGDDIRPYNAAQPTNMVKWDRVGINVQYYIPKVKGLSLLGYHTRIIGGRNTAKINAIGIGITYQFNYLKSKK